MYSDLCNDLCSTPTSLDLCGQLLYKLLLILLVHVCLHTTDISCVLGEGSKNAKSWLPGF